MALDKVLIKIQGQINELAPTLELFVEDSIQPSVSDCDELQFQLVKLQESIAVYKYNKQEKEISPSFNLHAKVSEVNIESQKSEVQKTSASDESVLTNSEEDQEGDSVFRNEDKDKTYRPLAVAINDKFRFINELFKQNGGEYNIAIEQINSLNSWSDAEMYLTSLKMIYNWKDNSETVIYFSSIVKKRFN